MTPGSLARIVERRGEPALVELLRDADPDFREAAFEPGSPTCFAPIPV